MSTFAYIMAGLFVLIWVVLLIKLIGVVSSGKRQAEEERDED